MKTAQEYEELGRQVIEINRSNGWNVTTPDCFKKPFKIPCVNALIQSELSEALEAARKGDWENFVEELADAKIRILDCLSGLGVSFDRESIHDICEEADPSIEYRTTEYAVGFVLDDISLYLSNATLAWRAQDIDRYADELIWAMRAIESFAEVMGLDLEEALQAKLEKNKSRGFRHGNKAF